MAATGDVFQHLPAPNFDCTDPSVYKPAVVDKNGYLGRPLKCRGAVVSKKVSTWLIQDSGNFSLDSDLGARRLFGGLIICTGNYGAANRTITLPSLIYLQPYINQWAGCCTDNLAGVGTGAVSGTTLTRYMTIITFNIANYDTSGAARALTLVAGAGTVLAAAADRLIASGETIPLNLYISRTDTGTLSYSWNLGLSI